MDIIILVIAVAVGAWKASQVWHLLAFRKIMQELKITDEQLLKVARDNGLEIPSTTEESEDSNLPILEVRVEQQPEGLFAYRKADSMFLAMGKDRETLMENLVNNLNNVRVIVAKEDGGDLISP